MRVWYQPLIVVCKLNRITNVYQCTCCLLDCIVALLAQRSSLRSVVSTFANNKAIMSADVDRGNNPVGDTPGGSPTSPPSNERSGQRRRNKNRRAAKREPKFEGKCGELKDAVYDVVSGKETFTKTTRDIAEYVGRQFEEAGEFRTAMVDMELAPLVEPTAPTDTTNVVALELWKMARRTYEKKVEARRSTSQRVYALVLGQCSQALRNRMEPHVDWPAIDGASDVMRLLGLVQSCMTQRQTRKHPVHTLIDAEVGVLALRQRNMANNEYYEKFKDLVTNSERLGGEIGVQTDRVNEILQDIATDPDAPTDNEREAARSQAKDEYLAILFLLNSDKKRYGNLMRDIENEYTRGTDSYPTTLSAAYDYLVNYRVDRQHQETDDGGLAFYQDEDDPTSGGRDGGGRGRGGGRGAGRGGGRGRGRSGGRGGGGRGGSGRGRGDTIPPDNHMRETDEDAQQFLLDSVDNLDQDQGYSVLSVDYNSRLEHCFRVLESRNLPRDLLLLDSCSTICLVANGSLLRNIHTVNRMMHVRCNAGVRRTNQMGWLDNFPEPVWYDPKGAANILSLYIVKKYFHVQYDNEVADAFTVTKPDGAELHFEPTAKGLYALTDSTHGHSQAWTLVSTVADRKAEYTKREYRDALLARKIQNIIMFPATREYSEITDHSLLPNCPINRVDIAAAEHIFGSNLGALKGKTVSRPGVPVTGRITGVPPAISDKFQHGVVLAIDIMFINKIPFFITTSMGLHFGTVENLNNRQVPTIVGALDRVVQLYKRRGFGIATIKADPEFAPLQEHFGGIAFNLCAQDEHVPEIERYIRTVKDRVRSGYNSLPFERIPRLMVIRLVGNGVFWLNAFPHADGVSDTMLPRTLITGKQINYNKHVRIEFGSYVQTHETHTNDMRSRTVGAICLGPSGNEQGGHYFMSLATGRRLHRDRWTALPMPSDAIDRVNALGRRNKMPKTLTFTDRFGFELPDADDEVDDDHDSAYDPDDDLDNTDDESDNQSFDSDSDSDDDDDPDDPTVAAPPPIDQEQLVQPLPGLNAGVDYHSIGRGDEADNEEDDSDSDTPPGLVKREREDSDSEEEESDDEDQDHNNDGNFDPAPRENRSARRENRSAT